MANRSAIAAAAWLASALGVTHAGVIRDDRADALYLDLATQPEFEPVGRLNWNDSGQTFLGSGVLIDPQWVLTAGHVVGGSDGTGAGVSNVRYTIDGSVISGTEWIAHPEWAASGQDLFAGWDLGLVRLSRPVNSVEPATLYMGDDELGLEATAVGFGATGTGLTGATGSGGTMRAGTNVIDVVGSVQTPGSNPNFRFSHDRLLVTDFDRPGTPSESTLGSPTPLDLEYLTAPGDSGGGLFIEVDGETVLAGITSLGSSSDANGANGDYGDRASYVRVSQFIDWIEETAGLDFSPPVFAEGDYNGDGFVDEQDYDQWRGRYGLVSDETPADGNNDGRVDAADYTVWRDAFGGAAPAVAIPEPGALATAIAAIAIGSGGLCRSSRR